ncbi:hypothetical protein AgCh_021495 [Apium graveolens]
MKVMNDRDMIIMKIEEYVSELVKLKGSSSDVARSNARRHETLWFGEVKCKKLMVLFEEFPPGVCLMIEGLLLYSTSVVVGDAGLTLVCALGALFLYSTRVLVGELWSHPALCTQELGITCPVIWWVILIRGTGMRLTLGVNRGYTCVLKSREIAVAECYPCAGRCTIHEVLRLRTSLGPSRLGLIVGHS